MKLSLTSLCFLVAISTAIHAQQAPQYSMYMLNVYNFNPAFAGLDNSLSITGVFRKQWADLEGSPTSQGVNMHMPLYFLSGGFGINVENELLGAERNTSALLSYSYWIPIDKQNLITIGLGGGFVQKSLDGSKLRARDGEYGPNGMIINHNDALLPINEISATAPTLNVGIYLQNPSFEIGLAANNLLESKIGLGDNSLTEIQLKRNYFVNFTGLLNVNGNLAVQPSILLKSDLTQTQLEISAIVNYNSNIFGGASFRGYNSNSIDAIALIGGFKLSERVTLAYSYDLTLSDIKSVSNGSHEVLINYNLSKPLGAGVPPEIIFNPRFL